jgi:hypothetical protein
MFWQGLAGGQAERMDKKRKIKMDRIPEQV